MLERAVEASLDVWLFALAMRYWRPGGPLMAIATALSLVALALAWFRQSGYEKVVSVTVKLPPSQPTPEREFSI